MLLQLRNEHITNIGEPFEFIWPEVNPTLPFMSNLDYGFPFFLKKNPGIAAFFWFHFGLNNFK